MNALHLIAVLFAGAITAGLGVMVMSYQVGIIDLIGR